MPHFAAVRGTAALAIAAIAVAMLIIAPRLSDAQVPPPAPSELPKVLVLVRADNPVDALSAGAVAGQLGAHVQLTDPDELSPPALDALETLQPDLVILAGGTSAISTEVEEHVESLGFETRRYGGTNRLETSRLFANIAEELGFGRPLLTGAQVVGDATLGGVLAIESLTVESRARAVNLNADLLDGYEAADFLRDDDLDGRVSRAGEFRISTNDWRVSDEDDSSNANSYLQPGTGLLVRLLSGSNAATGVAVAYPDLPVSLFGESLDLVGMELCYDNSGSTLVLFGLRSWVFSAEDPVASGGASAIVTQNSPAEPTGAACERLDLPAPYTLTPDDRVAAVVQATLPNQNASNLELYRLTFILQATP